jgi:hypothetical protein
MKAAILGGAIAALLAGDCVAQGMLDGASGAAPSASTRSQYVTPGTSSAPGPRPAEGAHPPTSSKVFFDSLPQGARVEIQNIRRGCVTPCSLTVPYNIRFSVVFTKRGYQYKEMDIAPPMTDQSKAAMLGGAIGGGIGGLIGAAIVAKYQYTLEPFTAVLSLDSSGTGGTPPSRQVSSESAAAKRQAAVSATPAAAPGRAASASGRAAAQAAPAATGQMICTPRGCEPVKAGCRVEQPDLSSGSAIGGQSAVVVCR